MHVQEVKSSVMSVCCRRLSSLLLLNVCLDKFVVILKRYLSGFCLTVLEENFSQSLQGWNQTSVAYFSAWSAVFLLRAGLVSTVQGLCRHVAIWCVYEICTSPTLDDNRVLPRWWWDKQQNISFLIPDCHTWEQASLLPLMSSVAFNCPGVVLGWSWNALV